MPEEKADEMVADVVLCENCDEPVSGVNVHHEERSSSNNGNVNVWGAWTCTASNWRDRAKKAEAELTACYNEIFWTIPEAMPLVDKIKAMHGLEADAILRGADTAKKLEVVQKELDELKGKKPKVKEPKLEPIDPELGDHMSWADFVEHAEGGGISDDDGCANLATETHVSTIGVSCCDARYFKRPAWCSHIVWYNR